MHFSRVWCALRRCFTAAAPVFVALAAFVLAVGPARAELTICNKSENALSIAIGYKSGADWMSEGWWNVATGDCRAVIDGDLQNRHYYYRDFNGHIAGEGYFFCTTRDEFTIAGDADCVSRSYERADFAHLDTGSNARDFTLTITGPATPVAESDLPMTEPAAVSTSGGLPPAGTYGEPFSVTGRIEGCDRIDGLLTCQFDVEGWLYTAYDDNRNLMETLDFIDSLPPGTEVAISGDMVSFGDISADVVIREIAPLGASAASGEFDPDDVSASLAGWWLSADDSASEIGFTDAVTMEEAYAGETLSVLDYFISDACPDSAPTGTPHLVTIDRETADQFCYEIIDYGGDSLALMYLPRGNILEYGRSF